MTARLALCGLAAFLTLNTAAQAAVITFASDPFEGTTALTTPGRQIVGGELFVNFFPATDTFLFDTDFFDVGDDVLFANNVVASLPTSNLNVIVLQSLDNDGNPGTPFGAGSAADLIAGQITTDGAGFFIYFNSGLNLPRLVYSTNLNRSDADLRVLARLVNLTGQSNQLTAFTAANFDFDPNPVPEPSAVALLALAAVGWAARSRRHGAKGPGRDHF